MSIHAASAPLRVRLAMSATPMRRALRIAVRALPGPLPFGRLIIMPRVDLFGSPSFLLQQRGHDARESFARPLGMSLLPPVIHQTPGAVDGEVYGNTPDASVPRCAGGGQEAHRKAQRARHGAHLLELIGRIQSESEHRESLSGMLGGVPREQAELVAAGHTPGGPEGEDDDLACRSEEH